MKHSLKKILILSLFLVLFVPMVANAASGTATVKYVDENTKEIGSSSSVTYELGKAFTVTYNSSKLYDKANYEFTGSYIKADGNIKQQAGSSVTTRNLTNSTNACVVVFTHKKKAAVSNTSGSLSVTTSGNSTPATTPTNSNTSVTITPITKVEVIGADGDKIVRGSDIKLTWDNSSGFYSVRARYIKENGIEGLFPVSLYDKNEYIFKGIGKNTNKTIWFEVYQYSNGKHITEVKTKSYTFVEANGSTTPTAQTTTGTKNTNVAPITKVEVIGADGDKIVRGSDIKLTWDNSSGFYSVRARYIRENGSEGLFAVSVYDKNEYIFKGIGKNTNKTIWFEVYQYSNGKHITEVKTKSYTFVEANGSTSTSSNNILVDKIKNIEIIGLNSNKSVLKGVTTNIKWDKAAGSNYSVKAILRRENGTEYEKVSAKSATSEYSFKIAESNTDKAIRFEVTQFVNNKEVVTIKEPASGYFDIEVPIVEPIKNVSVTGNGVSEDTIKRGSDVKLTWDSNIGRFIVKASYETKAGKPERVTIKTLDNVNEYILKGIGKNTNKNIIFEVSQYSNNKLIASPITKVYNYVD